MGIKDWIERQSKYNSVPSTGTGGGLAGWIERQSKYNPVEGSEPSLESKEEAEKVTANPDTGIAGWAAKKSMDDNFFHRVDK